uniref:D-aminoacyl-tRNA deacylase n=1 Tax=Attheya septentrionalis TaxID=420275 RepID=A0A7S2XSD6_9STRA|mmetsp:Transcript_5224/g.9173  ORF Transcript_5224/g.9173 Transcript_5224/m.9173 type:complete len:221 (+) Transcript_5224:94-756(+)
MRKFSHCRCRLGGVGFDSRKSVIAGTNGRHRHSVLRFLLGCFVLGVSTLTSVEGAMRLVLQRVKSASVRVEGKTISSIGPGIMALVGLHEHDTEADLDYCCRKLLAAKLWANENGAQWRHGVKQKNLEVLLVSQFTLYGTLSKKNQPDYKLSMKAVQAQEMYSHFLTMVGKSYDETKVQDGIFGAMMDVELINDGPVTIVIDSDPQKQVDDEEEKADGSS